MTVGRNGGIATEKRMSARVLEQLTGLHDRIFSDANRAALKRLIIKLSIAGFAIHLALIFLSRSLPYPPLLLRDLGQNYLSAISTPFNFVLFYEVLTLIAALAVSTTRSIANQFEIVSLIFIRDVFKDIADASGASGLGGIFQGGSVPHEMVPVFLDMWAALAMFLLAAVFQYVAMQRVLPSETPERSRRLKLFIAQKKVVAIGLAVLLLGMAAYHFGLFVVGAYQFVQTGAGSPMEPVTTFYNDLFTVMILTDVLLLILSLVISGRYEMVFRNAAFVVSVILLRFSLTEHAPYGVGLALLSMLFGILTLLAFNFHMRLQNPRGNG
jgi:hypothetical protein